MGATGYREEIAGVAVKSGEWKIRSLPVDWFHLTNLYVGKRPMKFPCWFIAWRLLIGVIILSVFTILPVCQPVAAQTSGHIQELQDVIEDGRGVVYTLRGLKKGDTLYAYMANTGGNLDPMLGILKIAVIWILCKARLRRSSKIPT